MENCDGERVYGSFFLSFVSGVITFVIRLLQSLMMNSFSPGVFFLRATSKTSWIGALEYRTLAPLAYMIIEGPANHLFFSVVKLNGKYVLF